MKLDKLVKIAVTALEDVKAHDITVLNVIGATTLFDRMIIASADSTRQTRALANNVQDKVRSGGGAVYGIEGGETGEWVLVDLGDVLVHIMQTSVRAHTWTPTFAKLSFGDFKKVKIAAIHPDFM
jgi:ribosome-associated protein